MRVLLAGLSTRAAADSAARAGYDVIAIDGFGDRDQHPAVRSLSIARDLGGVPTAASLTRASRSIACDAVAYLSPFENHPRAVATLASGRVLLGNPPDVLRRVRDPLLLAAAFRRHGLAAPRVRTNPNLPNTVNLNDPDDSNVPNGWLVKPHASGGGRRVRRWRGRRPVSANHYLQEFIQGTPGSVVFVAAGSQFVPLGITSQLVGEDAFGARGYQYCGSILSAPGPVAPERLAAVAAAEFGLVGVNGIDFIAHDGVPYPVEVNPRWSSSMELVERAVGVPLWAIHAAACLDGRLPPVSLGWGRPRRVTMGKAIVFARRDVVVGDSTRWLDDPSVRDVPHPGERIAAGRPVCTVFAEGHDDSACRLALAAAAAAIDRDLDQMSRIEGQFDA